MNKRLVEVALLSLMILPKAFSQTFTDGPSVIANADHRLEIFARASDGSVWHNSQTSPGGAWSGWSSLGGIINGAPVASINADGRVEIFALAANTIWHNWQTSPGGGWSGWNSLAGNMAAPPTVATNADGRLQLFALGADSAGWTAWQVIPNGGWSDWTSLGGGLSASPQGTQNADGRLEIFALAGNTAWNNWQASPGGAWSGWHPLNGSIVSPPAVGINNDGRLEIFAKGTDGAAWHIWQQSPGSDWGAWESLDGGIDSSPSVVPDGNAGVAIFVLGGGGIAWTNQQVAGVGWSGWSSLGGYIVATPAVATNFDGRLEIFGLASDGTIWHEWQLISGGAWSGWAQLTSPSDGGGVDTTVDSVFLSDSQNASNFASVKNGGYPPPWKPSLPTWPCGARVNITVTGYSGQDLQPFHKAVANWNLGLYGYYGFAPVQLSISAGGPQSLSVSRVPDDSFPSDDPKNPKLRARVQTGDWNADVYNHLISAKTQIIRGMTNRATLANAFAHELGHTFGLDDCTDHPNCGTVTNVNGFYKIWSNSVMDSEEPGPPSSHGWDDVAKNFTEGLPGPTNADLQVIDSHLSYRQCGSAAQNAPPPDIPACTNGGTLGFMDTSSGSTYTCNGTPCDGCNSACNNYAPQSCGGGGAGGGSSSPSCSNWCGYACMDNATCPSGGIPQCNLEDEGWVPVCNTCPIVMDAFGEGFHLTGLSGGVQFRVTPGSSLSQMSWTDPAWRNGWLALDRNGNGSIDDFTELFGDLTPQPGSDNPNGYVALALFDEVMNGGNNNGVIDPSDSVYDHLRLWIDTNHNGFSEAGELHALRDMGIFKIDLNYHASRYVDQNGNSFRYKSRIWDAANGSHDVCYDVFLQVRAQTASGSN